MIKEWHQGSPFLGKSWYINKWTIELKSIYIYYYPSFIIHYVSLSNDDNILLDIGWAKLNCDQQKPFWNS